MIPTGIISVGTFSSSQAFQESAGPALRSEAAARRWSVTAEALVPSQVEQIASVVQDFARQGCQLILINGGTGITLRDVTPEAVLSVARMEIPGFGEEMRSNSRSKSPRNFLSRCLGAIVEQTLVIALPGDPQDAVACLAAVADAASSTVDLLQQENSLSC